MFHLTFGMSAAETGLLMTAWPLVIVVAGPLAGTLATKIHPGLLGGVGLLVMSVGCFLLADVSPSVGYGGLVARLMLCGFGFGLFQSPNNHLLLSSAPSYRTGGASGMQATARLVGQTTGAALVALLFISTETVRPMPPCGWPAVLHSAEALYPVRVYGHTVFERFYFLCHEASVCFRMFRVLSYLFLSLHLHSTPRRDFSCGDTEKSCKVI